MYVHAPPPAQAQNIINDGRRISIQTQISNICNSSEYKRLSATAPNDDRIVAWRKELTRLSTELSLLVSLQAPTPVIVPKSEVTVPEVTEVTKVVEVTEVAKVAEVDEAEEDLTEEVGEVGEPGEFDMIDDIEEFN